MHAFYKWLAAMRERNVDVALQAGWWFTRDTYLGSPSPEPKRDLDRFPRWVSNTVHEIVEKRGFHNVKYLILLTEPTSYETGVVPPGETQWSYYVKMMHAIDQRLRADGRRSLVKLVGPNNSYGGKHLKEAAAELNDVLDIYSGHDYNKRDYDEWFDMCHSMAATVASTGKPFWLDELGKQDETYRLGGDYGTYQAQIVAASINAGLQTSMQWLLFDQLYVAPIERGDGKDGFHLGVHRWGRLQMAARLDRRSHLVLPAVGRGADHVEVSGRAQWHEIAHYRGRRRPESGRYHAARQRPQRAGGEYLRQAPGVLAEDRRRRPAVTPLPASLRSAAPTGAQHARPPEPAAARHNSGARRGRVQHDPATVGRRSSAAWALPGSPANFECVFLHFSLQRFTPRRRNVL